MAYFKKFKKLKFWIKREERGNNEESNKEDLETNLRERTEGLQKKLEKKDAYEEHLLATNRRLWEALEEQSNEMEQLEANLTVLQEKLKEREQVVANLHGCVNETTRKTGRKGPRE